MKITKLKLALYALPLVAGLALAVPTSASYAVGVTQNINIVVPSQTTPPETPSVTIVSPNDGSETNSANVDVVLSVTGQGVVTITDQDGNVLFTYNKTTDGTENITAHITLPGNPGKYTLTAKIDGTGDSAITITWNEINIPIPPVIPSPPDTGYIKFLGYAMPIMNVVNLGIYLILAVVLVLFVIRMIRRTSRQN